MNQKVIRLGIFFVVCCIGGLVALYFLFSPKWNPHFMESLILLDDLGPHEKLMMVSSLAEANPSDAARYQQLIDKQQIADEDLAFLGLPKPKDVTYKAADGAEVHGWYFEQPNAPKTALLIPTGSMFVECTLYKTPQAILKSGASLLMFDYRGNGKSTGKANLQNVFPAADEAYSYATNELKIPADKLVIASNLYGCFPAKHLAMTKPCAGIVMVDPMDSVKDYNCSTYPPTGLVPESDYPSDWMNLPQGFDKAHPPLLIAGEFPRDWRQLKATATQPAQFLRLKMPSTCCESAVVDPHRFDKFVPAMSKLISAQSTTTK